MGGPPQARADPQLPIRAAQSHSLAEPDKPRCGQSGQSPQLSSGRWGSSVGFAVGRQ